MTIGALLASKTCRIKELTLLQR